MHSHALSDADRSFRDDFESSAIPPAEFTHEAQVRLAYAYLAELDVETAVQRMRAALSSFLEHNSIPTFVLDPPTASSRVLGGRAWKSRRMSC